MNWISYVSRQSTDNIGHKIIRIYHYIRHDIRIKGMLDAILMFVLIKYPNEILLDLMT